MTKKAFQQTQYNFMYSKNFTVIYMQHCYPRISETVKCNLKNSRNHLIFIYKYFHWHSLHIHTRWKTT